MVKELTQKYFPYLLLALCVIIAFAPVALMQNCMKYDMSDQYFAWRYYVGECLQSGYLPLWNPYVHLGYPIHADPQSGAWYPIVWLIGALFGYTIYWIQVEFLFHVFLACVGMYLLTNFFVNEKRIALLAAISYMLCGFFSGNAQHLTWIISGTWIPFILFYFLRFQQQGQQKDLLRITLCFFMLITGGYPAFVITVAYSLVIIAVIHVSKNVKNKNYRMLFQQYSLLVILLLLSNAVSIVSLVTNLSSSVRSGAQSLSFVQSNAFLPKALMSWLFPLASVKNPEFFFTDISMSNGYFGLLGLAGLVLFIFKIRTKHNVLLFISALLFLFIAFGEATPLRGWLYHILPLFDRFRFPSLFRVFAIMLLLVCSAIGWKTCLSELHQTKKNINTVFAFILSGLIVGVIYSSSQLWRNDLMPDILSWNTYIYSLDFNESIFLQGLFQLAFFIVVIILFNRSNNFIKWLPCLVAIDLSVATLINNPITVINDEKPFELQSKINKLPKGFPIPLLQPMENFKDRENSIGQLWLNLGIWNKQPYWQGYNSFQSPLYNQFGNSPQATHVLKNPLVYLSSSFSFYKDTIMDTLAIASNHTHLYLADGNEFKEQIMEYDSTAQLQINSFTPNQISVQTTSTKKQWVTLLQQRSPGWSVEVDHANIKPYTSNYLFTSAMVPPGRHSVTFNYQNTKVIIAFWISVITLVLILIRLSIKSKPQKLTANLSIST